MAVTNKNQLLLLCGAAICGIWGVGYTNGLWEGLDTSLAGKKLLDGRPLRTRFTGIRSLDDNLALLTVFYEILCNQKSAGPRMLFFHMTSVVSTTAVWSLIESRRRGTRNWLLRYPVWMLFLSILHGLAIFQPPYFYLLSCSRARVRDSSIPLHDAMAIFVTTMPIMFSSLLLFMPAWLGVSTWDHHGYIGLFYFTPLFATVMLEAASWLFKQRVGVRTTEKTRKQADESRSWVVASLVCSGIVASVVYIYVVTAAITTTDQDATLARLFVFRHGRSNAFPEWLASASSPLSESLPYEYKRLMEACHLLTQYDWLIVSLSCIVFFHILLAGRDAGDTEKTRNMPEELQDLVYLTLFTLLLGPGGAGSFAMAIRELRLGQPKRHGVALKSESEKLG